MAKLIKIDGTVTDIFPANGKAFTLKELQICVGGYIEIIRTAVPEIWMVCDEEGKLKDKLPNITATSIYFEAGGMPTYVVGDVLVGAQAELDG